METKNRPRPSKPQIERKLRSVQKTLQPHSVLSVFANKLLPRYVCTVHCAVPTNRSAQQEQESNLLRSAHSHTDTHRLFHSQQLSNYQVISFGVGRPYSIPNLHLCDANGILLGHTSSGVHTQQWKQFNINSSQSHWRQGIVVRLIAVVWIEVAPSRCENVFHLDSIRIRCIFIYIYRVWIYDGGE